MKFNKKNIHLHLIMISVALTIIIFGILPFIRIPAPIFQNVKPLPQWVITIFGMLENLIVVFILILAVIGIYFSIKELFKFIKERTK